jgi:hydrogenase maturation protease
VRPLVIGYGNPLRGDDGVGCAAADVLRGLVSEGALDALDVLTVRQLTPELADDVARASRVVFIDASVDAPPGCVGVVAVVPGAGTAGSGFTHQCDPGALLALAALVYGRAPAAWLVTVGAADFECEERLSPAVAAAVPDLVDRARRLLVE